MVDAASHIERVGFTGSRDGMTNLQGMAFSGLMARIQPKEFHHGVCVGSDAEAHKAVRFLLGECKIHGHPPNCDWLLARVRCDVSHRPKPYLARNRDIVDAADALIAAPDGPERQRSGTWSTVRHARRLGRRIYIIWPDGRMEAEG